MIIQGQVEPLSLFTFTIDQDVSQKRLDHYLSTRFPDYSRSFLQQLILKKSITRNGLVVTKPSTIIQAHDTISIQFPPTRQVEQSTISQETSGVTILETTEHFMVIYKPPHLLVHPPSNTSTAITLTDWIKQNHSDIARIGVIDRPGIIHRLDKDTSGIMIITRTNHAHTVFGNLFKERAIHKTYHALVEGHPQPEGAIDFAIGRDPANRAKMTAFDPEENHAMLVKKHSIKIRHALSHYKVLQYFKDMSLVEIKPTTGRTHQIRVHMSAIGHPIIGDHMYGKKSSLIARQALHAYSLSFTFDDKEYNFRCPIPHDIQNIITTL